MVELERIERELRENLASFDAEVAYELENEGERADLWTDIDVPVEALRALLSELSRLRERVAELEKATRRLPMAEPKFIRSLDPADCPDFMHHTPSPDGYLAWHDWARKMLRTHRQIRCTGCGLYAIWIPRKGPVGSERGSVDSGDGS